MRGPATVADLLADLLRVGVEDRHDAEAVVGEDVRAGGDGPAEVAGAEQRDVVLAGGAQDLADLRDERVDVVADAALAELAEAREVAADLRGVDVRVLRELLRGDRLLAHLLGLGQHLQVAGQAGGNAQGRAAPAVAALTRRACRWIATSWSSRADTYSSARTSASSSTNSSHELVAVERDDGDALEVAACNRSSSDSMSTSTSSNDAAAQRARATVARVVAQVAARPAVERDAALTRPRGVGVEAEVARVRRSGSTKRAAEAIIAALSVHSSRGGTCTRDAERRRARSRSAPLAATPPPMARRPARSAPARARRAR